MTPTPDMPAMKRTAMPSAVPRAPAMVRRQPYSGGKRDDHHDAEPRRQNVGEARDEKERKKTRHEEQPAYLKAAS